MNSIWDIVGPIMVGPSSSHTAGAARLGKIAKYLSGEEITDVTFELHGSFAKTYQGHGTDRALVAGILGFDPSDFRLRESFRYAQEAGLAYRFVPCDLGADAHPNTVRFRITTKSGKNVSITGSSIGGGNVVITDIDGISVYFTGNNPILVTRHEDKPGVVAMLTAILYARSINIATMRVLRLEDTDNKATMYVELDNNKNLAGLLEQVEKIPGVEKALLLDKELL